MIPERAANSPVGRPVHEPDEFPNRPEHQPRGGTQGYPLIGFGLVVMGVHPPVISPIPCSPLLNHIRTFASPYPSFGFAQPHTNTGYIRVTISFLCNFHDVAKQYAQRSALFRFVALTPRFFYASSHRTRQQTAEIRNTNPFPGTYPPEAATSSHTTLPPGFPGQSRHKNVAKPLVGISGHSWKSQRCNKQHDLLGRSLETTTSSCE